MNEPWNDYNHIWATKSAFFVWLRGGLRRAIWEKYPPKIEFKNESCSAPPEGYTGRAKSGAYCALSGEWEGKSKLEVDHLKGHISLKDWDDVLPFILHLCANKSQMSLVTKEAHRIKSYAERMGITYEEAVIEKKAIEIMKLPTKDIDRWLSEKGVNDYKKNPTSRREAVRSVFSAIQDKGV